MTKVKKLLALGLALCLIVSAFAACSFLDPSAKLIGAWRDSTGTTGYEFLKDNVCNITYADVTIPIINYRFNGTVPGSYTTNKADDGTQRVTVTYTILNQSLSEEFIYKVEGNTLTLTAVDGGKVLTLIKYTPEAVTGETTAG